MTPRSCTPCWAGTSTHFHFLLKGHINGTLPSPWPEPRTHPHGLVREPGFARPVLAPGPQELFGLLFRQNRGGPWKNQDRALGTLGAHELTVQGK